MTALLELRENLKKIYSRNEAFITPVIKFLLSFIVLSIINGKMGYMTKLDNMAIVLIVSLLCSFLPTGFIVLFAMMFSLLHMYALSLETAAVGLVVFLLLYLLFLVEDSLTRLHIIHSKAKIQQFQDLLIVPDNYYVNKLPIPLPLT